MAWDKIEKTDTIRLRDKTELDVSGISNVDFVCNLDFVYNVDIEYNLNPLNNKYIQ